MDLLRVIPDGTIYVRFSAQECEGLVRIVEQTIVQWEKEAGHRDFPPGTVGSVAAEFIEKSEKVMKRLPVMRSLGSTPKA